MITRGRCVVNVLIGILIFFLLLLFSNYILVFANKFIGINKNNNFYINTSHAVYDEKSTLYVIDNDNITIYISSSNVLYQKKGIDVVRIAVPDLADARYIDQNKVYSQYPYIFIVLDSDKILIYNTETKNQKIINVKVCPSASVKSVSYDNGFLSWRQYKEWSVCTGVFQKKIRLDF